MHSPVGSRLLYELEGSSDKYVNFREVENEEGTRGNQSLRKPLFSYLGIIARTVTVWRIEA